MSLPHKKSENPLFFNPSFSLSLYPPPNRNDPKPTFQINKSKFPHSFSPFIPKNTFQENHICKNIDEFQCDNSQNFISQCADSNFSACPLLDIVMDCRMKNTKILYQSHLGPSFMSIAQFGENSKCLRVSDPTGKKSVSCMQIKCADSKKKYQVFLPDRFGRK